MLTIMIIDPLNDMETRTRSESPGNGTLQDPAGVFSKALSRISSVFARDEFCNVRSLSIRLGVDACFIDKCSAS